jgi:hypothetical protein
MDSTPTAVPGAPRTSKSLRPDARQPRKTAGHALMETGTPKSVMPGPEPLARRRRKQAPGRALPGSLR